jgi:hypothetical protein
MRNRILLAMALLAGVSQLGCGDSGGGGTCAPFSACGGDPTGKWAIDGVCAEGNLAETMFAQTGLPAACSGVYQNVEMNLGGIVEYANGVQTSNVDYLMTLRVRYTPECLAAIAGAPLTATQYLCDSIASGMTDSSGMTGSCVLSNNGCDCDLSISKNASASTTYTLSGSTLTNAGGAVSQICVSGDKLTVRGESGIGSVRMQFTAHRSP